MRDDGGKERRWAETAALLFLWAPLTVLAGTVLSFLCLRWALFVMDVLQSAAPRWPEVPGLCVSLGTPALALACLIYWFGRLARGGTGVSGLLAAAGMLAVMIALAIYPWLLAGEGTR